jgi:hypothetical protein
MRNWFPFDEASDLPGVTTPKVSVLAAGKVWKVRKPNTCRTMPRKYPLEAIDPLHHLPHAKRLSACFLPRCQSSPITDIY